MWSGLKAKLWLIILLTKKKRVILNGDGSVNGIKINRCKCQKTNLNVQHAFFSISLPLFCTTTMYGGIVVCAYQKFCFLCSCSLLFFHCRSFSPCWLLAFLIISPPLFFQRNSSPLFSITRSSSFSVINVNVKNNVEKDSPFLLFFLAQSPGGLDLISFLLKLELHLGCHTC